MTTLYYCTAVNILAHLHYCKDLALLPDAALRPVHEIHTRLSSHVCRVHVHGPAQSSPQVQEQVHFQIQFHFVQIAPALKVWSLC